MVIVEVYFCYISTLHDNLVLCNIMKGSISQCRVAERRIAYTNSIGNSSPILIKLRQIDAGNVLIACKTVNLCFAGKYLTLQ